MMMYYMGIPGGLFSQCFMNSKRAQIHWQKIILHGYLGLYVYMYLNFLAVKIFKRNSESEIHFCPIFFSLYTNLFENIFNNFFTNSKIHQFDVVSICSTSWVGIHITIIVIRVYFFKKFLEK